jgi:predicted HicB family RNase H-like nuclease
MAELPEEVIHYENDPEAIAKMRARFKNSAMETPQKRKQREQKIRSAVDGRCLKATGRTEQFNFKCREGTKRLATEAAKAKGISIAEWMERAVALAIEHDGGDIT